MPDATSEVAEVLFKPESAELRFLPEGPYALSDSQMSWVAIQHGGNGTVGSLNLLDLATRKNQSFTLPGRPGFAFPTDDPQTFVVGCERTLGFFNTADGSWLPFCEGIDADVENTIINDAVVWDGNLIFGCKELTFSIRKAGLYLWRRSDHKLIRLRHDQICSNGKAIMPKENGLLEFLDIDSPTRQIVAYDLDIDGGTLTNRRVVVDVNHEGVVPDGMILAPDRKHIIVSMYNPDEAPFGETRQYRISDGQLVHTWQLPGAPQCTCPQLVQREGKVYLVMTTAVEHMSAERQAGAANSGFLFWAPTAFSATADCPIFPRV